MSNFAKTVIDSMEQLLADLRAGVPIEATEVRRMETPDGPMHVRRTVVIGGKDVKQDGEETEG